VRATGNYSAVLYSMAAALAAAAACWFVIDASEPLPADSLPVDSPPADRPPADGLTRPA
jgi:hypothetical protein